MPKDKWNLTEEEYNAYMRRAVNAIFPQRRKQKRGVLRYKPITKKELRMAEKVLMVCYILGGLVGIGCIVYTLLGGVWK